MNWHSGTTFSYRNRVLYKLNESNPRQQIICRYLHRLNMHDWLENGYHDDKSIAWQNHFDENRRWIKHMILQNRRYKTHNLICLKAQCMRAAAFDFTFNCIFAYKSSGQSHAHTPFERWKYIDFVGLCFLCCFCF